MDGVLVKTVTQADHPLVADCIMILSHTFFILPNMPW